MYNNLSTLGASLLLAISLAGCSTTDPEQAPAELVDFEPEIRLEQIWDEGVGDGQGDKYNRLKPVINRDRIYAVSADGELAAFNRNDGDRFWKREVADDVEVSGGVGYGNGMLYVGLVDSRVMAFNAENGELAWEGQASSEVLSAPQYTSGQVIVQTVDGNLVSLDSETGERRWIYENSVPALTLRGTSSPLILGDTIVAGFGNGSVVAVATNDGTLRWEQRVALPTGRSDIERLVDVDGQLLSGEGNAIIAPSYQGYLAVLDPRSGQIRWRAEESTVHGPGQGFGNVYVANVNGRVSAYEIGEEEPAWVNDTLTRRKLSAPVSFNNFVVVGDFEGYIHFLSQVDGRFVARERVDGDGVRAPMLTRSNTLYVYGNSGTLAAYRISEQ